MIRRPLQTCLLPLIYHPLQRLHWFNLLLARRPQVPPVILATSLQYIDHCDGPLSKDSH